MAYQIIGTVHRISATEQVPTRTGGTLLKRTLILIQRRFDQNTGEEFEPNYPTLEFTNNNCQKLDRFKVGDRVKVMFDINGYKYNDKNTNEEKYSSSLRGFNVEPYVVQQPQQQAPPPNYQQAPPQYQPQPPYHQGGYPAQQYASQPPSAPPPQGIDPNSGLPF